MLLLLSVIAVLGTSHAFSGNYYEGEGDDDYVGMLDTARRLWGPDIIYQSIPMLYKSVLISFLSLA